MLSTNNLDVSKEMTHLIDSHFELLGQTIVSWNILSIFPMVSCRMTHSSCSLACHVKWWDLHLLPFHHKRNTNLPKSKYQRMLLIWSSWLTRLSLFCEMMSLYTNIPQDGLLDVINTELLSLMPDNIKRFCFIRFLETLIRYNVFCVFLEYYIQNIGIPMGGVLSPCLANIYLGVMERFIQGIPEIICYRRYVDDVLLLSKFSESEMKEFLNRLQSSFHLTLTASVNQLSVNF